MTSSSQLRNLPPAASHWRRKEPTLGISSLAPPEPAALLWDSADLMGCSIRCNRPTNPAQEDDCQQKLEVSDSLTLTNDHCLGGSGTLNMKGVVSKGSFIPQRLEKSTPIFFAQVPLAAEVFCWAVRCVWSTIQHKEL